MTGQTKCIRYKTKETSLYFFNFILYYNIGRNKSILNANETIARYDDVVGRVSAVCINDADSKWAHRRRSYRYMEYNIIIIFGHVEKCNARDE